MNRSSLVTAVLLSFGMLSFSFGEDFPQRTFNGMCDASGSAYLGGGRFVIADDESNVLRIYDLAEGKNMPVGEIDLGDFLEEKGEKRREADIEGCTQIGDTLYWITSHGRNKDGKWRPTRYRFFATQLVTDGNGSHSLKTKGVAFRGLLLVLAKLEEPGLLPYIGVASKNDKSGNLAPKKSGLNIESISASNDGKIIYIGLRNPRPGGKAVLLPLLNPAELITGGNPVPRFGAPVYFDFGGLGFRAMEYSPYHRDHIMIAGPHSGGAPAQLYRWSGEITEPARRIRELGSFNPETLLVNPAEGVVRFISDDGSVLHRATEADTDGKIEDGRCECKDLKDPARKGFRMVELDLPR